MEDWGYKSGSAPVEGSQGNPQRAAAWIICLAAVFVGLWWLFGHALEAVLPFVLAYPLGRMIRPLVSRAVGKSRLPRGMVAAVLVILPVGLTSLLLSWGVGRAVAELEALLSQWGEMDGGPGAALARVSDWFHSVSRHIPLLRNFRQTEELAALCDRLDAVARQAVQDALTRLGGWVSGAVVGAVTRLPAAALFVTVWLLSCYYVAADDGSMEGSWGRLLRARMPSSWKKRWPALRERGRKILRGYLRAYVILAVVTFGVALIALSVMGVPYAFLAAFAVALVDLLPVFGTGTVLIPWAVIQLVLGETGMGVGLLILWGICTLLHQVLEPRLVSVTLGIHPLLSLLSVYAGLRFFGFFGMILFPVAITAAKGLLWPTPIGREKGKNGES